ncbi:hypothetical protein IQ254_29375 [Nodosilinea sp. LEGE 07088]|uniref:hypothetical protein n=1 Tax=Nodosilinea sp. LEGE 07088 TaxID=2777968 RepID=UPI00188258B3|nr:hypothetical protein [Nodosilinea sp. LEGE 07088]MBE9141264.1 hypothetical protein [Nodosilinea sp. LEGE 07088]
MSNFWPEGIEISDTQSPREILKAAQEDWQTSSRGVMELILQDATTKTGNPMIKVHAKHVKSNRTAMLFSVVYRPNYPYPATIQPKDDDLPDFLKKTYYVEGQKGIAAIINSDPLNVQGKMVSNEWVSDTPPEFRKKLAEAFNLGIIKSEILNLASSATDNANTTSEELLEGLEEN